MSDINEMMSDGAKMLLHLERLAESCEDFSLQWDQAGQLWVCEIGGMNVKAVSPHDAVEALCRAAVRMGVESMQDLVARKASD
jgi:hypothetical protein